MPQWMAFLVAREWPRLNHHCHVVLLLASKPAGGCQRQRAAVFLLHLEWYLQASAITVAGVLCTIKINRTRWWKYVLFKPKPVLSSQGPAGIYCPHQRTIMRPVHKNEMGWHFSPAKLSFLEDGRQRTARNWGELRVDMVDIYYVCNVQRCPKEAKSFCFSSQGLGVGSIY